MTVFNIGFLIWISLAIYMIRLRSEIKTIKKKIDSSDILDGGIVFYDPPHDGSDRK